MNLGRTKEEHGNKSHSHQNLDGNHPLCSNKRRSNTIVMPHNATNNMINDYNCVTNIFLFLL